LAAPAEIGIWVALTRRNSSKTRIWHRASNWPVSSLVARTSKTLGLIVILGIAAGAAWRFRTHTPDTVPDRENLRIVRGGELVASLRSDPATYNRYIRQGASAATEVVTQLVHARLIRVNRSTDEIEPSLAESWSRSDDGLTYTLRLRRDAAFSDGMPFTSADVLFSFRAAYDDGVKSPIRTSLEVAGKPLQVSAPDSNTVVIVFPQAFAPGLRLLDNLPILPKHKLDAALNGGTFAEQWAPSKPLGDIAGLGPFTLVEHVSGQRLVFARNPRYFRKDDRGESLPYLDRLTLAIVPDQNTEALRLEAGETDLMVNGEIRPQDYAAFKRAADEGRVRLLDVGVGLDPDFLSFNLRAAKQADPRWGWLGRREFRQAIAWGVDRQAIADTVYLGAAVPISTPVSPGNRTWYSKDLPAFNQDPARSRQLLASLGLRDRNGDGTLEDKSGAPVRFSILTQGGHNRERVVSVLQSQLGALGIAIDIVALDQGGLFQRWSSGDYDAMYFGLQASSTDPWLNPEYWLSSGGFHLWNPAQPAPATDWEARIDTLMRSTAGAPDLAARQSAFADVQRILIEELPAIYFVTPRLTLATSHKVVNPTPAPQSPQLLWRAETLASAGAR
jgi:peptide/nickel transport system substrate-binding protein